MTQSRPSRTGIAVFGTGAFTVEHLKAFAELPGAEVRWIVGTDIDRARALTLYAPTATATTRAADAFADPEVSAVDIVTATPTHAPLTVAAGNAGRHVHVEKPAALSLRELDEMIAAVEGANRTLMVGQTVRFQPAIASIGRAVAEGRIGDPRLVHISWYTGHAWPGGWRAWQLDPQLSGGHPVHNGTHIIDAAAWLLGSAPREVITAGFPTFAPQMDSPDSFHIQLRTENGSLATLELCYALRQRGELFRRIVLVGSEGTLHHTTAGEDGLQSGQAPAPPASVENALRDQLEHWLRLMRGEVSPIVTTAQVRTALATALTAQRSIVSGRRELVAETPGFASTNQGAGT